MLQKQAAFCKNNEGTTKKIAFKNIYFGNLCNLFYNLVWDNFYFNVSCYNKYKKSEIDHWNLEIQEKAANSKIKLKH